MYHHQWRQADGAMMAWQYFIGNMDFWMPRRNNLYLHGDPHGVSEFPILYYLAAWLYKWVGFKHWYLRVITGVLFIISLFSLRKLLFWLTGSAIMSGLLALLYFTSPIVVYYAPNFMPDIPAVSLGIIGLYAAVKGFWNHRTGILIAGIMLVALGGVLKPPAIILYLAAAGTCFVLLFANAQHPVAVKTKQMGWWLWVLLAIPVVCIAIWFAHVHQYNALHGSRYYLTTTSPIYSLSPGRILSGFIKLFRLSNDYLSQAGILVMLTMAAAILVKFKQWPKPAYILYGLFTLLALGYFSLFFEKFHEHDYYMNVLMPAIPLTAAVFFASYQHQFKLASGHWQVAFGLAVVASLGWATHRHSVRTTGYVSSYTGNNDYLDMAPETFGITPSSHIYVPGDRSGGVTLYFMKRDGYTDNTASQAGGMSPDSLLHKLLPRVQFVAPHPYYEPTSYFNQLVSSGRLQWVGTHRRVKVYKVASQ